MLETFVTDALVFALCVATIFWAGDKVNEGFCWFQRWLIARFRKPEVPATVVKRETEWPKRNRPQNRLM